MDQPDVQAEAETFSKKRRTPKACNHCRHSKAKCDELRPVCSRCHKLDKQCVYVERAKTAHEAKIDQLEHEIAALRQQLLVQHQSSSAHLLASHDHLAQASLDVTSPRSIASLNHHSSPSLSTTDLSLKRKRSRFSIRNEPVVRDFVQEGLLSQLQAATCFDAFFRGCNRYVPCFDGHDTLPAIRDRSSLLFNAICAVGCGVSDDLDVDCRMLYAHLKRWLTIVILNSHTVSIDSVLGLLIMACWMPERSIILAIATRIAADLQLDSAFDRLVSLTLTSPDHVEAFALMKSTRTWFLLMNLEQILQVDAGNLLGLRVKGVRRCRALLDQPFSVALDARLFSQVELNHLRTKINDTFVNPQGSLLELVEDARIDIEVWFHDWKCIMTASHFSGTELPSLLANLTIQRYWAEAMAACRAVRATGIENIQLMSSDSHDLLKTARTALQSHLDVMLNQQHYLAGFRYAMDFVWAKCAFSFLLLIKLTVLLADDLREDLLRLGRVLHERLSRAAGYGSSKVYVRLLELSIEKYEARGQAQPELDAFVPEEFTYEWDWHFPLNLFTSSIGWDLLFDQYLIGDDLFTNINTL